MNANPEVQRILDEFLESISPYEAASREQDARGFPLVCASLEVGLMPLCSVERH